MWKLSPSEKSATCSKVTHAIGEIKMGEFFLTQYKVRATSKFFIGENFHVYDTS